MDLESIVSAVGAIIRLNDSLASNKDAQRKGCRYVTANRTRPAGRFGRYTVDLHAGELHKNGRRIKLQEQPLRVLSLLLEHRGELVTRDDLRQKLWPSDTFVDFDHGLNSAVARLREVLNDSAEDPKYIETLARRGYRFIAPVNPPIQPVVAPIKAVVESPAQRKSLPPIVRRLSFVIAAALLACATWYFVSPRVSSNLRPPRVVPFTSLPDRAEGPAFSPDGNYVAFARHSNSPELSGIYIKQVGGDRLLQLTKKDQDFCCPAWSPDGRYVAFSRFAEGEHRIYLVSAIGGAEHKIFAGAPAHPPLDWSPDGKFIAFTAKEPGTETYSIFFLSVDTLSTRKLSEPPVEYQDWGPAFSPDGKQLAFIRMNSDLGDIFIMPASGGDAPGRLTFDHASIPTSPVWTRDGRSILFSSTRSSIPTLWRIPVSGGTPTQVPQVGVVTMYPSISPTGHRLAYQQIMGSSSIWSTDLRRVGEKDSRKEIAASKGYNRGPEFSPDGKKIAFDSDRSGTMEIWVCNKDGSDLTQLTHLGGAQSPGPPRWSPDGRRIAFDSTLGEHNSVFVMTVEDGLHPLTHETSDSLNPSWSRDGKWIYFASVRSGEWQIWKMPSEGGDPIQVTKKGGRAAFESPDGQFLYYAKTPDRDIWKLQLLSGQENRLSPGIHVEHWSGWSLADNGIFFLGEESSQHPIVKFFGFSANRIKDMVKLDRPVPWRSWISVSADGRFVLYPQKDQEESNLMLLENFQ